MEALAVGTMVIEGKRGSTEKVAKRGKVTKTAKATTTAAAATTPRPAVPAAVVPAAAAVITALAEVPMEKLTSRNNRKLNFIEDNKCGTGRTIGQWWWQYITLGNNDRATRSTWNGRAEERRNRPKKHR
jgi:hypothetical protein